MSVQDSIRIQRNIRQWSQEEMAEKMDLTAGGYAKIERGETKLSFDKLQKIAQIFEIDVVDLLESGNKNVFLMSENSQHSSNYYGNNENLVSEIEKLKLMISHQTELLKQKEIELENLRKIISLLENK